MKSQPDYSGKKILLTAFSVAPGSEALATYEFIKAHGASDISTLYYGGEKVAQKIPDDVTKIEVDGPTFEPSVTEGYDLVFRHQTTRPELIKSPHTTNTIEFFTYCDAPVIAVTGTKGKGTTTSLAYAILQEAGLKSHLIGNIGLPAISALKDIQADDIVCFEISSFQLWDLKASPEVAVVLMMAEDHQDVHNSIPEYIAAKQNIARYQTTDDITIYHPTNLMSQEVAEVGEGKKIRYMTEACAHVRDDSIWYQDTEILPVSEVGLIGAHNLENVCAAISAIWGFTQDVAAIRRAVAGFTGLEHRLEEVATKHGVRFINDSFSAAVPAATAAINAFEEPVIVILGGFDKQVHFDELAEGIADANLKHAILIGQNQAKIAEAFDHAGIKNYERSDATEMREIVKRAGELAEEGDVVVLSPGSASFDMFENYKHRGMLFREAVGELDG